MGRSQDNQSNNVQGDPHQEHNYLDGVATEKSQEIQSQNVQRHQRQEHNYLDGAMESSSPQESDRDNEQRQEKDKISQCAPPTQAGSAKKEKEDEPKLLSLLEAASVELVATGRISDPRFLPGWLYDKEKKSSRSYFENVTTPRNEVFWKDEAGLTSRRYSKNDRKRDRARRAANRHMVINLKVPKRIKVLLDSTADSSKEWSAVNFVDDIARVKPEGKNAMAADWETVAVLLIRLLIGSPSYTKLKILELLQILAEVYIAKLHIVKLGGFHILTQVMLLGNTTIRMKRTTVLLLCSLCEARENIGSFLKEGVAEAVMLELSLHGSEIIDEFNLLISTVSSETILTRFLNSSQLLMEGAERTNVYPKALSIIQSALQELRGEGYGNGGGWDW